MIRGVHHVSFSVSDMERSLAFYTKGLRFEILDDRTVGGPFPSTVSGHADARLRIVHLKAHGIGLELIQYIHPQGRSPAARTCDVGSAHVCFIVDDIDEEVAHLEGCGARFVSTPQTVEGGPNSGNRCVYFLDPDGIPMELTQPG